jgi:hypothetical protein
MTLNAFMAILINSPLLSYNAYSTIYVHKQAMLFLTRIPIIE